MKIKIICSLFGFSIALSCSSCGVDTRGWPHIAFSFESSNVSSATVYYQSHETKYASYFEDELVFFEKNDIEKLMNLMEGYPYKTTEESNIDLDKYASKVIVSFNIEEVPEQTSIKTYQFYGYGIGNSKVILDDGSIHFLPGATDCIYSEIKGD